MSNNINWPNYNNTLIDRGNLEFWIPGGLEENWYCDQDSSKVYTDQAIEILSILRFMYKLTFRSVEGFAKSFFQLLGFEKKLTIQHRHDDTI